MQCEDDRVILIGDECADGAVGAVGVVDGAGFFVLQKVRNERGRYAMNKIWPAIAVALWMGECPAEAFVLRVPSQYPTIQAAIDVVWDTDTVLVADGTYTGAGNRGIDFKGKNFVLLSDNGPQYTIILKSDR